MFEWIDTLEDKLVRAETWALVVCVVVMLLLAGYNVLYRNALMPLQTHLRTSGAVAEDRGQASESGEQKAEGGEPKKGGESDGFGGGFGEQASEGGEQKAESGEQSGDEAGGFGGGFGDGGESGDGEQRTEDGKKADGEPAVDGESRVASRESRSEGGAPPEGSLAARVIDAIDAIKLPWIDILLRQLVLIVGFLGAMLAARRREHITIDAIGQIASGRTREAVDAGTSTFAALVCVALAASGWNLVELGMEYPRELFPWADQWTFQLMFPIGFGLTGLHFALRALESGRRAFAEDGGQKAEDGGQKAASGGDESETGGEG